MNNPTIEHINICVTKPQKTAEYLNQIFGWKVRWQSDDGSTMHVGSASQYLSVWSTGNSSESGAPSYGGLNHIGVLVEDLAETEQLVIQHGFEPKHHGDYEPGRRFYFADHDGIEYEVLSYN